MTVFGPGVGECIVLHLGGGDWMIVDSCVDPLSGRPAALDYLQNIGIDPSTSVRMILATHWHDDHVAGIAALVRECPSAQFVISGALTLSEFIQIAMEVNEENRLVKHNSSISELVDVLEILRARTSTKFCVGPHRYALEGSRLFHGGHGGMTEVWALSPSSGTMTNASAGLAGKLLTSGHVRRFKQFSENDLSVAVLVKTQVIGLLLGADLENTVSPLFGWKAVVSSTVRPKVLSDVFKVAHHGSVNADHDDIWMTLLNSSSMAIVTPYSKLKDPLPTANDISRIKSKAGGTYCTTWPQSRKTPRRKGVDGIVGSATKSRRAINSTMGHVRLRVDLDDAMAKPIIELFGSAKML